ncbi:MAG TPA: Mov34/MPN/PAD-1 family protein [Chryseosolibacter sp.]
MKKIEKVVITVTARQQLLEEINRAEYVETGGVLCGNYSEDSLRIHSISGPGSGAHQTLTEFVADKDFIDKFIDDQYRESDGHNIYIGEWHSHPQRYPVPSSQDLESFLERTYEWTIGDIVFIIVGFVNLTQANLQDQIVAVRFDKKEKKFFYVEIVL